MKTSLLAIFAAVAGLAIADSIDVPDCAKGCLNDDLQKAGCQQDNISDCGYCQKANVNSLVTCVSNNCKDQNDLLKAAQAAQKACPNGAGNGQFNGIPGFNNGGGNNGGNNGGGNNNGGKQGN